MTVDIIARIHTDLPEKFGVPRQSGLCPSSGEPSCWSRRTGTRTPSGGWRVFPTCG